VRLLHKRILLWFAGVNQVMDNPKLPIEQIRSMESWVYRIRALKTASISVSRVGSIISVEQNKLYYILINLAIFFDFFITTSSPSSI
jgi:hypothetical protein